MSGVGVGSGVAVGGNCVGVGARFVVPVTPGTVVTAEPVVLDVVGAAVGCAGRIRAQAFDQPPGDN
jgi:acyl dehydratase